MRGQDTQVTASRIKAIHDDIRAGRLLSKPGTLLVAPVPPTAPEPEPPPQRTPEYTRISIGEWARLASGRSAYVPPSSPAPLPAPEATTTSRGLTIAIDGTGIGSGVVDRLKHLGIPHTPVVFGGKPATSKASLYDDRAAEMYWRLREALQAGELALTRDEKLFAQLIQIEWGVQDDKTIKVFKQGREKSRPSPDRADALALAWEARRLAHRGPGIYF